MFLHAQDLRFILRLELTVRGDQVIRQWRLVRLLASTKMGRSIPDLQRELEVTSRTVRRDLESLEHAGFPLISETRRGDVLWRFIDGYQPESSVTDWFQCL
jgi:predicted DNA-binding transcriptional regulator YafY